MAECTCLTLRERNRTTKSKCKSRLIGRVVLEKVSFSHSTVRHYDREPASLVTRKEAGQRLGRARVNLRQSMRLFFGTRNFKLKKCKLNRASSEFVTFHTVQICVL